MKRLLVLFAVLLFVTSSVAARADLAASARLDTEDGKIRKISKLEQGDSVLDHGGRAVTISASAQTDSPASLVQIKTNLEHNLVLTGNHPVITPAGPVAAQDLKEGDTILTSSGPALITKVDEQSAKGQVWNVSVGQPTKGSAVVGATFYANGILVGDQRLQQNVSQPKKQQLIRLPSDWQQDYLNKLAQQ